MRLAKNFGQIISRSTSLFYLRAPQNLPQTHCGCQRSSPERGPKCLTSLTTALELMLVGLTQFLPQRRMSKSWPGHWMTRDIHSHLTSHLLISQSIAPQTDTIVRVRAPLKFGLREPSGGPAEGLQANRSEYFTMSWTEKHHILATDGGLAAGMHISPCASTRLVRKVVSMRTTFQKHHAARWSDARRS